nr:MAG TPA: hypothetical protein [Crassvirales sp.]DAV74128.1 MAG TPA: hypothetical protein [Bacteriophage sp.]DAW87440.1 MAG TPA: hypothetical protein [Bacteriophage sp.]
MAFSSLGQKLTSDMIAKIKSVPSPPANLFL